MRQPQLLLFSIVRRNLLGILSECFYRYLKYNILIFYL